jgi:hypothetical protein
MTLILNGTTGVSGVDGSAATPAFKGNDANTGISFGTDIVTINTGGTARVTTDASGNVGIGTVSNLASSKLDVRGRVRVGSGNSSGDAEVIWSNYASATSAWIAAVRQDVGGANNDLKFLRFDSSGSYQGVAMQIDSAAGNVGIGTSSPASKLEVIGETRLGRTAGAQYFQFLGDATNNRITAEGTAKPLLIKNNSITNSAIQFDQAIATAYTFSQAGTAKMILDSSGNLLVGQTSWSFANNGTQIAANGRIYNTSNTDYNLELAGSTSARIRFYTSAGGSGTTVGTITVSGSATTYATSSDYRLKENVAPMTSALATVAALKPVTYTWKADGSDGQGFIAHELQAVVPDCVTGTKDAVDAEGNPQYQGVDTSFLVATLVAAIQELKYEVDALKGAQNV